MLLAIALLACNASTPDGHDHGAHEGHADHAPAHGDQDPGHDGHEKGHDGHEKGHDGHDGHEAPAGELVLTLDGTAKWVMDDHTRKVMAKTRETIEGADTRSVESLHKLAATLQKQLDKLIQGCTMDGPSHDELHVFLMAWIPKVDRLKTVEDVVAGQATVAEMKTMLTTYDQFFE
jgi:hypothetical protein